MLTAEAVQGHLTKEIVQGQLALLVEHQSLRSSRRLVSFLEYVVCKTLNGEADQLKERTIGIEVFNRDPDYETSGDHIVRTAASELRKRLALYYGDDAHRSELRIDIPSGSYVPQFTFQDSVIEAENYRSLSVAEPAEDISQDRKSVV